MELDTPGKDVGRIIEILEGIEHQLKTENRLKVLKMISAQRSDNKPHNVNEIIFEKTQEIAKELGISIK